MTKSNFTLRTMQAADLSAVLLIEQERDFPWSIAMLQDCLAANYESLVLTQQGRIIGFAILATSARQADILNIVVATNYLRRGFGEALLRRLIEIAEQKAVEELFLEVRISNYPAISLYEKLNFTTVGIRPRYYPSTQGKPEDAKVMRLTLRNKD